MVISDNLQNVKRALSDLENAVNNLDNAYFLLTDEEKKLLDLTQFKTVKNEIVDASEYYPFNKPISDARTDVWSWCFLLTLIINKIEKD